MAKEANKHDLRHKRNIARYEGKIDKLYKDAIQDIVQMSRLIGQIDDSKPFDFADHPALRKRFQRLLKEFQEAMEVNIIDGIEAEWNLANGKNDELVKQVLGHKASKLPPEQQQRYFNNHDTALEAFKERTQGGMNLSERVWSYTKQFKGEMEMALDIGIGEGRSAVELSRDLRKYLKHPDMLFRRVRDKHGVLHLSQRAENYHPGRGVYRSSYKNARRLVATETNMAYRTADHLRWQDLDFVVGIKISLSNNHTLLGADGKPHPFHDICDDLAGNYPKDFKFVGWHPHCRCFATPILQTLEEFQADNKRILNGEEVGDGSVNRVDDVPKAFSDWLTKNDKRLSRASSAPYFISDNPKYTGVPSHPRYGAVLGTKLGRTATKEALKIYDDMPAPTLTKEVQDNAASIASAIGIKKPPKPMTFLEANDGRANVDFGRGKMFSSNCQIAVAVHEARLRGLNVTALGYNEDKNSIPYMLGERYQDIWEHPKTGKTPKPTYLFGVSFDDMLRKLSKQTQATGRYHIGINMKNSGHVITAERLANGRMIYYDPQPGQFIKIEEYANRTVESLEIIKVDKLLLRRDIFKFVARVL